MDLSSVDSNRVAIGPGSTFTTATPKGATSARNASVRASKANLEA
jgi:hypothetical protein